MAEGRTNSFGKGLPKEIRITYMVQGHLSWWDEGGSRHQESDTRPATETAVFVRQIDDTYKLTSGSSKGSESKEVTVDIKESRWWSGYAEIVNMEFVWD